MKNDICEAIAVVALVACVIGAAMVTTEANRDTGILVVGIALLVLAGAKAVRDS